MKIIAESGATKTDWRLITDDGQVRSASGPGLNPSVLESEQMGRIVGAVIPQLNPEGKSVEEIFFYGAGLEFFPVKDVRIHAVWASNSHLTQGHYINVGLTWNFNLTDTAKRIYDRLKK